MKLPSDGLTLKEVREINGTPTTYKMDAPCRWEDFKAWPEDIQREYLEGLQKKYRAPLSEIARVMGVKENTFISWKADHGIKSVFKGRSYPTPEWETFKAGAEWLEPEAGTKMSSPEPESGAEEDPSGPAVHLPLQGRLETEREPVLKFKPEALERLEPEATLQRLLDILPALKASGAKIKIEVEL